MDSLLNRYRNVTVLVLAIMAQLVLLAYQAKASASRVLVRYVMTYAASVTLTVKPPKGRAVTVARASARAGLNQLAWNRKLGRRPAGRGTYRLTITATFQGRKTSSGLTVRLR